jgi:hypothetical protein
VLFSASVNEAVEDRVAKEVKRIQEAAEANLDKAKEDWIKESEEDLDKFLDTAIKEWTEKNASALAGSVKVSMAEKVLRSIKEALEAEGIEAPEADKDGALKEAQDEIDGLKESIEDLKAELEESKRQVVEFTKRDILREATAKMTRVSADRVTKLAENVTFKDAKQFARSVLTLAEAFGAKIKLKEDLADENKDGDKPGVAGSSDAGPGEQDKAAIGTLNADGKLLENDGDKNSPTVPALDAGANSENASVGSYFCVESEDMTDEDKAKLEEAKRKLKEDAGVDTVVNDDGKGDKSQEPKSVTESTLDIVALTMKSLRG